MVELSPEEQQGLETLVRRYQQLARRGRIILSAAAGLNNSQIAREVGLDVVRYGSGDAGWGYRQPFQEGCGMRLVPPARITPEQVCQIMSLASVRLPASAVVLSATSRELADEIIEKGIVERHAARLLETPPELWGRTMTRTSAICTEKLPPWASDEH